MGALLLSEKRDRDIVCLGEFHLRTKPFSQTFDAHRPIRSATRVRAIVGAHAVAAGGTYLHALSTATRSAKSCGDSCWSSPDGISDTLLGVMLATSARATRSSLSAATTITISSG